MSQNKTLPLSLKSLTAFAKNWHLPDIMTGVAGLHRARPSASLDKSVFQKTIYSFSSLKTCDYYTGHIFIRQPLFFPLVSRIIM